MEGSNLKTVPFASLQKIS